MKTGIQAITEERERQISAEGWTPGHDDMHIGGELADAATCYAYLAAVEARGPLTKDHVEILLDGFEGPTWPWEPETFKPQAGQIRSLAKAGALIAAEIDRLNREESRLIEGYMKIHPDAERPIHSQENERGLATAPQRPDLD